MKDWFIFIAAALESIELIQSYTEGHDLPGFLADRKTQDAVFSRRGSLALLQPIVFNV